MGSLQLSKLYVNNIYSKNGASEAINIDSDGRVTTPARPAFLAYRNSGASATLTEGNYHQIFPFDAVEFDIGGNYNTTNYNYVCPVDGVYFFALNARIDGAGGNYVRGIIYKGDDAATQTNPHSQHGDALFSINGAFATNYETINVSGVLQCSAGDKVTAMGGHNTDTLIYLSGESQFSGFLVG